MKATRTHTKIELSLIGAIEERIGRVPSDAELTAFLRRHEGPDGWNLYTWHGEELMQVLLR